MISADDIMALRPLGLISREAAAKLKISYHTFLGLLRKYGITWPHLCRNRHPADDKITISGRERCRLCWEAKRVEARSPFLHPTKPSTKLSSTGPCAIREAREAEALLDRAIEMETAPPWVRHPVADDPRDWR